MITILIHITVIHNTWYARSCLQKCSPFQYEPCKRLAVQSQQLEQSLKYVCS